jgi:hypothetical protein
MTTNSQPTTPARYDLPDLRSCCSQTFSTQLCVGQGASSAPPPKSAGGILVVNNSSSAGIVAVNNAAKAVVAVDAASLKDIAAIYSGLIADGASCTLVQGLGHAEEPIRLLALAAGGPLRGAASATMALLLGAAITCPIRWRCLCRQANHSRERKREWRQTP